MSSREQFEAWAEKNGHDIYRSGIDGAYYFQSTQWSWDIWQAATNAMEAKCAALAAENAGLKNFISEECLVRNALSRNQLCAEDVSDALAPETPATDSFLAEVRAQGVDTAIDTAKNVVAQEFQYKDFETAQRVCSYFPESDLVGKVEMVEWLEEFAAQLRQDANTAELVAAGIITRIEG